ncbi:hypothetical protein Bca101_057060 [Brassica carinata]
MKAQEEPPRTCSSTRGASENREVHPQDSRIFRFSSTTNKPTDARDRHRYRSEERRHDARHAIEAHRRASSQHDARGYRETRTRSKDDYTSQLRRPSSYRTEESPRYRNHYNRYSSKNDGGRELEDNPDRPSQQRRSISEEPRREDSTGSLGPRISTARGTPLQPDIAPVAQEILSEAIEEIREAMHQYTQCADPTESAVRKDWLRRAEEEGGLEETASRMVHTRLETKARRVSEPRLVEDLHLSAGRVPATLRLGPLPSPPKDTEEVLSAERLPATLRLGPMGPPPDTSAVQNTAVKEKRKPGRPPGRKKVLSSPLLKGACYRKRKVQRSKPPPVQRKLNTETDQGQS